MAATIRRFASVYWRLKPGDFSSLSVAINVLVSFCVAYIYLNITRLSDINLLVFNVIVCGRKYWSIFKLQSYTGSEIRQGCESVIIRCDQTPIASGWGLIVALPS